MNISTLSKRNSIAQGRIKADAALLAGHLGADPALVSALSVQEKDPAIKAMKEREAIASLLSAITVSIGLKAIEPTSETEQSEDVTPVTDETLPEADLEENEELAPKKRGKKAA